MGISIVTRAAVTPAISAAVAYADGDALGGLMEFSEVVNPHARSGTITGITIIDKDNEQAAIDVFLFDATFTPTADNSAWPTTNPTEAVLGTNCIGILRVAVADYATYNGGAIADVAAALRFRLPSGVTTLYAQAVVRAIKTYTATTDLTFVLDIAKD